MSIHADDPAMHEWCATCRYGNHEHDLDDHLDGCECDVDFHAQQPPADPSAPRA